MATDMGLSQIQHVACQHTHRDRPITLMQPGRIGSAGPEPVWPAAPSPKAPGPGLCRTEAYLSGPTEGGLSR